MVKAPLAVKNLVPLDPVFKFETSHTQTLLGHFSKSPRMRGDFEQKFLSLSVGDMREPDQCSLKIYRNKKPIVLSLYHGLSGDHTADYIQRSAVVAFQRGWSVVLVDHRGAGYATGKAKLPYHSGRGEDISDILIQLKKDFPQAHHVAIGFSMSGSMLFNLLSKRYGTEQPHFAITVNAPLDLAGASHLLTKGFSKAYDIRFFQLLKRQIQKRERIKMPLFGNLYDIDDLYTSLKSGYKNKEDYYQNCSAKLHVHQITTPTYVLTAKDDPFIAFSDYAAAKWSPSVHLTFSDYGGHIGYISRKKIENFGHHWLDHYLSRVLDDVEIQIEQNSYSEGPGKKFLV